MTGIDTNILVRYIMRDNAAQAARADAAIRAFTSSHRGFIGLVALAETAWVLRSGYRISKPDLIQCIDRLLCARNLVLENSHAVRKALQLYEKAKCDFSDCLIAVSGSMAGCTSTITFDVDASRSAGMVLI